MKNTILLLIAFVFISTSVYGEPVELTLPTNGQVVYEEIQAAVALPTNISARVDVYLDNTLAAAVSLDPYHPSSVSNVTVKIAVTMPGTNILKVDVWQTELADVYSDTNGHVAVYSDVALIHSETVAVVREYRLNAAGWIFLILGWGTIISLAVFAYSRIFGINKEKIVEPLEIDTGDEDK